MTEIRHIVTKYRPTDQQFRYIAAGLAYLVAALHLFHPKRGFPRLALILTLDQPLDHILYDPRPAAFVLSGLAIIIGVKLVLLGFSRKPIYALGMALIATYFVGYFVWHLTGHGGILPGREPLYHGLHPVASVISHLQEYPIARASKIAEAMLFAILAFLYYNET